tara:strand:+ start:709 stop:1506 length:798 start_codon:yes stop_codon:yes gene_type:complete
MRQSFIISLTIMMVSTTGWANLNGYSKPYEQLRYHLEHTGKGLYSSKGLNSLNKSIKQVDAEMVSQAFIARNAIIAAGVAAFHDGVLAMGPASETMEKIRTQPSDIINVPGALAALKAITRRNLAETDFSANLAEYVGAKIAKKPSNFPNHAAIAPMPRKRNVSAPAEMGGEKPFYRRGSNDSPSAMERMLALGAMHILTNGNIPEEDIRRWTKQDDINLCIGIAVRNLDQCEAASRGLTEKAFCTQRHTLTELNRCFRWLGRTN